MLLLSQSWLLIVLGVLQFEGVEGDEEGTREGVLPVVVVSHHGYGRLVVQLGLHPTPIA